MFYCYQATQEHSITKQILGWAHLLPESATPLAPAVTSTRNATFTRLSITEKRRKRMSWKEREKGIRKGDIKASVTSATNYSLGHWQLSETCALITCFLISASDCCKINAYYHAIIAAVLSQPSFLRWQTSG